VCTQEDGCGIRSSKKKEKEKEVITGLVERYYFRRIVSILG
jgi:hypothetical protein